MMLLASWNDVAIETFHKCWSKSRIIVNKNEDVSEEDITNDKIVKKKTKVTVLTSKRKFITIPKLILRN